MNRTTTTLFRFVVLGASAGALCAGVLTSAPADAQQWVPPPPVVIATTEPVYYEGHAAYWHQGHWYWRDERGGWNHYDREPPFLSERRAHFRPAHRSWERREHR